MVRRGAGGHVRARGPGEAGGGGDHLGARRPGGRAGRGGWCGGARLGVYVHWAHASQLGWEISWPLVGGVFSLPYGQAVAVDEYHALAATFDPTALGPAALARSARH